MNRPFEDASFDIAISIASIKHWSDPVRGLREIRRMLKPDGRAFVVEADRDASFGEMRRWARDLLSWFFGNWVMSLYNWRTVFRYSLSQPEAATFAREAGFANVSVGRIENAPFILLKLRR